ERRFYVSRHLAAPFCDRTAPCLWCDGGVKTKEATMSAVIEKPAKVIYTAKTHTTGGREKGAARSSDGRPEVRLSVPGTPGQGTNSEQLFAAGWSACFEGAMGLVARKMKIQLPEATAIDAEVDLNLGDDGYFLRARLDISLPGIERDVAQAIVDA